MRAAYETAQAALCGCRLDFDRFAERVSSLHVTPEALRQRAPDVYLAWAAGQGDTRALAIFEHEVAGPVEARLRARRIDGSIVDDVMQTVRERLFTGATPRILTFSGAAPLINWTFVVAMRAFLNQRRRNRSDCLDAIADEMVATVSQGSAPLMTAELHAQLRSALRQELIALDARTRTVFRLHFGKGSSLEAIGRLYGVNRSTVARWLWRAEESIREGLRRRFGMARAEFDSFTRGILGRFEYDLSSALRSARSTEPR